MTIFSYIFRFINNMSSKCIFNKRAIFRDLKARLTPAIKEFSQTVDNGQRVAAERLSYPTSPRVEIDGVVQTWTLNTLLYSFRAWGEKDETSRLYRQHLQSDPKAEELGYEKGQGINFLLVLNADNIPDWETYKHSHNGQGQVIPSDEWCSEIENVIEGLAHEIHYYQDHCYLASLGVPQEDIFTNPVSSVDYNLLCSFQSIAKCLAWHEDHYNVKLGTLEEFTAWGQTFSKEDGNEFPFALAWREKWISWNRVEESIQLFFREFESAPRQDNGKIDQTKIVDFEGKPDFNEVL